MKKTILALIALVALAMSPLQADMKCGAGKCGGN
jgi:hypothetical protein